MNENRPPAPVIASVHGSRAGGPWDAAVVIPARNEARRIAACLHAVADAAEMTQASIGVVICVNDTDDDTASKAVCVLETRGVANIVVDLRFPPGTGGVGRARDLGCRLSQRVAGPPAKLMTTDADSRVDPDWIAANLAELRSADVVFGTIIPDPAELMLLRPCLARHGTIEQVYKQAAVRLANRLDPQPHDPDPDHRTPSGASIALTVAALKRLGGIPWHQVSEDRALAARAEALDLRVRHATRPKVITSCRLNGRAKGGMASTLQERCGADDPFCDAWIEPADNFAVRYQAKGALRAVWPDVARCWHTAQRLLGAGPVPNPTCCDTFGEFWQRLEDVHPALARNPLRHSDAVRELPVLLAHLARTEFPVPEHG